MKRGLLDSRMAHTFLKVFELCCSGTDPSSAALPDVLQARANIATVKAAAAACEEMNHAKNPRISEAVAACLNAGVAPGAVMARSPLARAMDRFSGLARCSDPLQVVRILLPECAPLTAEEIARQISSRTFAPFEGGADAFEELVKLGLVDPGEWSAAPFRVGGAYYRSRKDANAAALASLAAYEERVMNSWAEVAPSSDI